MTHISVQQVRDLIIDRLAGGAYPLSSKLPTTRELAKEIGAHRNTVAKAYQILAELGLLTLKQGRGTYVTGLVDENNRISLVDQIRASAADLIFKSRRLGIAKEELQAILEGELADQYASSAPRAAFIECNPDDTAAAVEEIEMLTGFRVAPVLLSTVVERTQSVVDQFDVAITSLFHVKEVSTVLNAAAPEIRVVGVYTQPDEDALSEIAQIRPGSRVAIIVSNEDGARRFDLQVRTVAAVSTVLLVKPDEAAIRACAAEVDVIISSRSQAPKVRAQNLATPLIVLPFHISQHSAAKIVDAFSEPQVVVAG
jgi:DNA-binding transcriptional regulator YhcF (GntR family)